MADGSENESFAEFLLARLASPPAGGIQEDTPLLSSGLVDSLTLIEFVAYLQKKFDVRIPSERLTIEQFDTVRRIEELVQSLRGASSK
jgi:acyl carrier protein